jgi:RND family efflux transporter MFP subunit
MKHQLATSLFFAFVWVSAPLSAAESAAQDAAKVDTGLELVTAQVEAMPRNHMLDGVVEAVYRTTVSARTSGQVTSIAFDVDDYVEKDQIILTLRDTEQRATLDQAQVAFKQAEADLERIAAVFETGVATQADMDRTETAFASAKAALQLAQEQMDNTVVRAPYTGIVIDRHVELGENVQPGMPLMTGISLEKMRVFVDVPQSMINPIRENQRAFVVTMDGLIVPATRIVIFPYADMASKTFRVRLELPEEDLDLFPGMFVKVGFFTGMNNLLMLPSSSIVYRSEVTGVYVVNAAGEVTLRHIRAGHVIGTNTVILSGLEPGEQVARDPVAAGVIARKAFSRN